MMYDGRPRDMDGEIYTIRILNPVIDEGVRNIPDYPATPACLGVSHLLAVSGFLRNPVDRVLGAKN